MRVALAILTVAVVFFSEGISVMTGHEHLCSRVLGSCARPTLLVGSTRRG